MQSTTKKDCSEKLLNSCLSYFFFLETGLVSEFSNNHPFSNKSSLVLLDFDHICQKFI